MLAMTDAARQSITGTRSRESVQVDAYLGDDLVRAGLRVESWSLTWDAGRAVQCSGTVKIIDEDGTLQPWVLGDTLGPGARLRLTWIAEDGSRIPRAVLVVTKPEPEQFWQLTRAGGVERWLPTGGVVTCSVEDTSILLQRDKLQAKTAGDERSDVVKETRRLLAGTIPLVDDSKNLALAKVASGTIYEKERLDAIDDLLSHGGLARRTDGEGTMHIIDPKKGADSPVWRIQGGDFMAALVSLSRSMDLGTVYNSVVATSQGGQGEHIGRAYLDHGVSRWGGPLGNSTEFYSSPLIDSTTAAERAAATRLAEQTGPKTTRLKIQCLPHPGLEIYDWVTVAVPTRSGRAIDVTGQVRSMSLGGDAQSGVAASTLEVDVDASEMRAVILGDKAS